MYFRSLLMMEDTSSSLVMIQPSLRSYSLGQEAAPVMLDSSSVRPDTILLLDTFFHIVVFHGETIASWRDQNFQEQVRSARVRAWFGCGGSGCVAATLRL